MRKITMVFSSLQLAYSSSRIIVSAPCTFEYCFVIIGAFRWIGHYQLIAERAQDRNTFRAGVGRHDQGNRHAQCCPKSSIDDAHITGGRIQQPLSGESFPSCIAVRRILRAGRPLIEQLGLNHSALARTCTAGLRPDVTQRKLIMIILDDEAAATNPASYTCNLTRCCSNNTQE
jgi:hypothetical protein